HLRLVVTAAELGQDHVAGVDLVAPPADLALLVGGDDVEGVLALGEAVGLPGRLEARRARAGERPIVDEELELAHAARLGVAPGADDRHRPLAVLPVDDAVHRDAGHVHRDEAEHRPHALALLGAALPAGRGAPGAVLALVGDEPGGATFDGGLTVAGAGEAE